MEATPIVIVGAGLAGIGAAESLIANGFKNVTIIEGENRIGGRIYTRDYGDGTIIEMGAQWIHGELCNPVFEIGRKHDLVEQNSDDYKKDMFFYLSNGTFISASVIRETFNVLDNIFNEANKFFREQIAPTHGQETVGTFVQEAFSKFLRTSTDSEQVKKMKEGLFNWRLNMEKTENGCDSVYDMSLCAWGEYVECAGQQAVELSHGYQPILDLFLKNIPESCFLLGNRVVSINWNVSDNAFENDKCRCKVTTSSGRTFSADHVIVTSSLGYLKKHANDLFSPALPPSKISAIKHLGFGTVNKIYLEFEQPFWSSDCGGIQLAWLPDDHLKLHSLTEGAGTPESSEWYKGIHGFDVVAHHTNLLCGWIAGAESEIMESLPDDLVLDVCHQLLIIFTNRSDIEKPTKIIRSSWYSNECTLGSYSYRHMGSNVDDSLELSRPLPSDDDPVLQFAGEATHQTHFSTTHGALLSGQREAARIINHHNQQQIPRFQ